MDKPNWLFVCLGLGFMGIAIFAARRPEVFLHGRRSAFWVERLGENGAKRLVRYVSVPIVVMMSLFFLVAGVLGVDPDHPHAAGRSGRAGSARGTK